MTLNAIYAQLVTATTHKTDENKVTVPYLPEYLESKDQNVGVQHSNSLKRNNSWGERVTDI